MGAMALREDLENASWIARGDVEVRLHERENALDPVQLAVAPVLPEHPPAHQLLHVPLPVYDTHTHHAVPWCEALLVPGAPQPWGPLEAGEQRPSELE